MRRNGGVVCGLVHRRHAVDARPSFEADWAPRGAGCGGGSQQLLVPRLTAIVPPLGVAFLETAAPFLLKARGRPAGELLRRLLGGVGVLFKARGGCEFRVGEPGSGRSRGPRFLNGCRGDDVHGAGLKARFCVIRSSAFGFDSTRGSGTVPRTPGHRRPPRSPAPARRAGDGFPRSQSAAWVI